MILDKTQVVCQESKYAKQSISRIVWKVFKPASMFANDCIIIGLISDFGTRINDEFEGIISTFLIF